MSSRKKDYLFLGFAIPNKEMEKIIFLDSQPQMATHKFNWNLIKGLESLNEFNFTYISSRPVTDYPSFPQKIIKQNKWEVLINKRKIEIQEIPFINISIFKIITRFISTLYFSIKNFHFKINKAGIIVYSVHVPYMLVGLIISRVYKIDYIAIWTDPPSVSSSIDSKIKTKLRNIELLFSKYLMNKATKVIVLTKYLANDFAKGKPFLVIEGIIDIDEVDLILNIKHIAINQPIKIIYTGSLQKRHGINNIIKGFISIENKEAILELYGKGDYEEELHKIIENNPNIIYKGFVPNKEILRIQKNADYLINARSTKEEYVKYSFPSKTLEYMLSGTPLISTIIPGMPDDYKKYIIALENNAPETIKRKLNEVLSYSNDMRNRIGYKAQKFVMSKNYVNQAKKIANFLNNNEIN